MTTAQLTNWVDKVVTGTIDLSDLESLEKAAPAEVVEQVSHALPIRFLDRSIRDKREVGLARKSRTCASTQGPSRVFRDCRLFTWERNEMTTVTTMSSLRARPSGKAESLELRSGAGFSLYRDPDGWKIKLIEERIVDLPKSLLRKHGWLFEHLDQVIKSMS